MNRRFNVECSDCQFEQEATGKGRAERVARTHSTTLDHDLLVVELPPRIANP